MTAIYIYVIYENPSDYVDLIVVRAHRVLLRNSGRSLMGAQETPLYVGQSMTEARKVLPSGLNEVTQPGEDPAIKEVWM